MFQENKKETAAVVLSGGGALGAWEVGVMKALAEGSAAMTGGFGVEPEIFCGTSVGGFNAAMMAQHPGTTLEAALHLERIWREEIADKGDGRGNGVFRIRGNPLEYAPFPSSTWEIFSDASSLGNTAFRLAAQFFEEPGSVPHRMLGFINLSALICADPFHELVTRVLKPSDVRKSAKKWRAVATDWVHGVPRLFRNEDMTDELGVQPILASAAIPGIFPPVLIGEKMYVDGGVVVNTPLTYAIDAGASEIHMLDLDPIDETPIPPDKLQSTFETFDRVYTAMLATKIDEDMATIDWLNRGIDLVERVEGGETATTEMATRLIRVINQIYLRAEHGRPDYRAITVHRHKPSTSLGGAFGMLNFHLPEIDRMIAMGYSDAKHIHNCKRNRCLLPVSREKITPDEPTSGAQPHAQAAQTV